MDVVDLPLEQIIPYARNPRRNEQAIATVAASIQATQKFLTASNPPRLIASKIPVAFSYRFLLCPPS